MIIEYKEMPGGTPYYTVQVGVDEAITHSGKAIPCTWLGTISITGEINLWRPAGYCPRDYKQRAMELLELARTCITEEQERLGGPARERFVVEIPHF